MKTVPYKNYVILNAYKSKPSDILLLFRIELILRFTKKCFHSIFYFPSFIHLYYNDAFKMRSFHICHILSVVRIFFDNV